MKNNHWMLAATVGAVVVVGIVAVVFATPSGNSGAQQVDVDVVALDEVGPLQDMILGDEDAPVTIIEYASLTCPHCAAFHKQVYPQIKSEYIDTGKVKLILREFPFDSIATAGFMLARCAEPKHYFGFIDVMFEQQDDWLRRSAPMEGIQEIARQGGFSDEQFQECLTDSDVLDGIRWIQERGASEFDVQSTPTFFINGVKVVGALNFEAFRTFIEEQLPEDERLPEQEQDPEQPS